MTRRLSKLSRVASRWVRPLSACALLPLLFAAGCGRSKFDYAPVSGQVLLDGAPVKNARVVFMPSTSGTDGEAGPYSNGETDDEGRYRLRSVEERPREGAVIGSHRIIVSARKSHLDPEDRDIEIIDVQEIIPAPYYDYRNTPLTFSVPPGGSDSADFALQSKKGLR